jgi:hypothetical protein
MKSKSERFADDRNDRMFYFYSAQNRKNVRDQNILVAKKFAPLFKAMREDRRFAACALEYAMIENGIYNSSRFMRAHLDSMSRHSFKQCDYIPDMLFRLAGAHSAKCDAKKIACYPTRADALRQREVVMSAGKFFAATLPGASPRGIQEMTEKYQEAMTPAVIHFATDADEWESVYVKERGFSSCMGGRHFSGHGNNHPARAYAHDDNDLQLAYLTQNGEPDGETVARAIVNDARKTYVRVYGDSRLKIALHAAGYSQCDKTLDRQKMTARVSNGRLIAPYIDGDVFNATWDGHSDFFVLCRNGDFECRETDGYASGGNQSECEECGDNYDSEQEGAYSDFHNVSVCQHCAETVFVNAYVGRRSTDLVREDHCVEHNGEWYLDDSDVLSAHNIVRTDDGELADMDDCIFIHALGEYVLADDCVQLSIPHDEDEWARECDTKTITLHGEEKIVHEDYDGEEDEEEEGEAA